MKKIFSYLLMAIVAVMLSACSDARQKLEQSVKYANSGCPQNVSADIVISGYYLEEDYVVISYLVGEESIQAEFLYNSLGAESFVQMAALDSSIRQLIDLMIKANTGLKLRVAGQKSGFRQDKTFEPTVVKEWGKRLNSGEVESSAEALLKAEMETTNQACPAQIDELTVMTRCAYEDGTICYYYNIIEGNGIMITDLNMNLMRNNLQTALSNKQDAAISLLVRRAKEAGAKLRYVYTGSQTGKTYEIIIDSKDL